MKLDLFERERVYERKLNEVAEGLRSMKDDQRMGYLPPERLDARLNELIGSIERCLRDNRR